MFCHFGYFWYVLQWGTYDEAYVAYDEAGNTAQCDFKIYVLNRYVFLPFWLLFSHFGYFGDVLQWGTYDVAYVAYDEAGNTVQCDFKIYVLNRYVFIHCFKYFCVRCLTNF
jgi:hypothetical protein